MTEQKYKEYEKLYNEIRPLKNFLTWCGDEFRCRETHPFAFMFHLHAKSIRLHREKGDGFYGQLISECEIPASIQRKIVALVEEYVKQKEEEMRNL